MHFSTTTTIEAPADLVWSILTDVPAWPTWNTSVTATSGSVALGSKVSVTAAVNPGRAFAVTVSSLDAPHTMVWKGGMPLGLFTGTRTFSLTPTGDATIFAMEERYAGAFAGMITRSIPDLQPSFDEFAQCLKSQAESQSWEPS